MGTEFLKVVVEYARSIHATAVAGAARLHLLERTVKAEHLVPLFFRAFDKLLRQISGIAVLTGTARQYYYLHLAGL